ncbi:hypothetical protein V8E52_006033, partial [Russula decolorans]
SFYIFTRRNKLRGTACFLSDIFLVLLKRTITGALVEMFGFLRLLDTCAPCALCVTILIRYQPLFRAETVSMSSPLTSESRPVGSWSPWMWITHQPG